MDAQITVIYCLCDDVLKALHHWEDPQRRMTDAEVMTTAIVAMVFFGGNFERARKLLKAPTYIPNMLSKSRFTRRLHAISGLVRSLFDLLSQTWKALNREAIYIIDSFPVAACDTIRIPRAKIYQREVYRGYTASKKRYFYGLKIHLMVTQGGQPVEFFLTPGSFSDARALHGFTFDLPEGSTVYADKAYNDYQTEDLLQEAADIRLQPIRKKNSKRPLPAYVIYLQEHARKMIETAGSMIERLLPKSIHAVTAQGFELKVALFVLASSIHYTL